LINTTTQPEKTARPALPPVTPAGASSTRSKLKTGRSGTTPSVGGDSLIRTGRTGLPPVTNPSASRGSLIKTATIRPKISPPKANPSLIQGAIPLPGLTPATIRETREKLQSITDSGNRKKQAQQCQSGDKVQSISVRLLGDGTPQEHSSDEMLYFTPR